MILTTGAVQVLDPAQLDAVLAHERALTSHHHRLVTMARIGRQVLPFLPLMQDAEAQVARLAEMHADDAATRVSDPRSLATALVVLAMAGNPAPALAAAATDAVQRIHRLLGPAEPLGRGRRQLLHHRRSARPDAGTAGARPSGARPRPAPDCMAGQHNPGLPGPVAPAVQHDSWPATPGCARCPAGPVSLRRPTAALARQPAVNNIPAGLVLPGMRIHRQNALPSAPTGQGHPADSPARHRRWRSRRRRNRGNAWPGPGTAAVRGQTAAVQIMAGEITLGEPSAVQTAPGEPAAVQTAPGETVAAAVQLAIGLLTASLDSLALESWAVEALTPHDADGMANFMAGLHVVSELLLRELCEATGEPPEATLQRLAFAAERWRGTSSAG